MSLEPLLGPHQLFVPIRGATEALHFPFWLDSLGLCGYYLEKGDFLATDQFYYCIFQYDGKGYARNTGSTFATGHFYYDFQTQGLVYRNDGVNYLYDPFTGNRIVSPVELYQATRYFDRYLETVNEDIRARPLTPPFTFVVEYTFVEPPGRTIAPSNSTISDYGGGLVAVAYHKNGDIYIYDPVAKTQVGEWKTIDLENDGIWWDKRLGVWISRHVITGGPSNEQLRVWADEARPATLSAPAALQAVTRGKVSDIRVQVLGDATDPVVGQLVEFELVSGPGSLLNLQALTDVGGYAISRYNCPVSASGSANIQAQTVF